MAKLKLSFLTSLENDALPFWKKISIQAMLGASQFFPGIKPLPYTMSPGKKKINGNFTSKNPVQLQ